MSNTLIVTVGSSPLPVVVSILHLQPDIVHLVHTPDVSRVVDRICDHLKRKLPNCTLQLVLIREHRSAAKIRARLAALSDDCVGFSLNYTGGTKLMAVHTHAFWSKNGGQDRNASYLSGYGRLYFDDPSRDPVPERDLPGLSLAELSQLHFGRTPHKQGDEHNDQKRLDLAKRIRRFVCEHGFKEYRKQLPPLYGENGDINIVGYDLPRPVKADWNAAKEYNYKRDGAFFGMNLSGLFGTLEVNATNMDDFSQWFDGEKYNRKNSADKTEARLDHAKWLWGGWLEVWLADQLAQARSEDDKPLFNEVHQNVEVGTKPDEFEMDVVAVRGYRMFLFSCTVDDKTRLVKSKFFEAANRTDRIGGEHARAAMLCLHEHPHEVLQTVQEEHWPGYDTLRLFGEPHVVGSADPCKVATGGEASRDVTLVEGIRQWVAT